MKDATQLIHHGDGTSTRLIFPSTMRVKLSRSLLPSMKVEHIRGFLRRYGIIEAPMIHTLAANTFLQEQGIEKLGAGAEGAVYFLRGHVVKLVNAAGAPAALREIAHLLFLNPKPSSERVIGQRNRNDWPVMIWVYVLTDGSMAIGMRTFDPEESGERGSDLEERLRNGPAVPRTRMLSALGALARSLSYMHGKGIVHHDLKPENIWLPADSNQDPIVFDLSQALWKQTSFGHDWQNHEYNRGCLYNGTFRYMQRQRRLAHAAAGDILRGEQPKGRRGVALERYKPGFYDDVFAFARTLLAVYRSPWVRLTRVDRRTLRFFYRRLMGLERKKVAKPQLTASQEITKRIRSIFRKPFEERPIRQMTPEQEWSSMSVVVPEFEKLLDVLRST